MGIFNSKITFNLRFLSGCATILKNFDLRYAMLKIFVTGDNHLGLRYANYSESAKLVEARISAFSGMVAAANAENCGLFVITGDLFDNTYGTTQRDIRRLLDMLAEFCGTVVVLPGNHDFYDKDAKVWRYFRDAIESKDNVMLITDFRPYEVKVGEDTVVLYPALCKSLHSESGKNNLGWIKEQNIVPDGTYRIGLAHGAVEGETIDREATYFLMKRAELESIPVDAWLIGHTHVPFPHNLKTDEYTEGERIFNAGTHVQTDVACNTEGCCFIVEISKDKRVRAKKIISGDLRFYRIHIALSAGEMENILKRELADIGNNSVVKLILSGAVNFAEYDNRKEILEGLLNRFIEGTYDDDNLSKLISKEIIDAEFPETSFSAKLLTDLIENPKEAQLAYELLKSLKEGK